MPEYDIFCRLHKKYNAKLRMHPWTTGSWITVKLSCWVGNILVKNCWIKFYHFLKWVKNWQDLRDRKMVGNMWGTKLFWNCLWSRWSVCSIFGEGSHAGLAGICVNFSDCDNCDLRLERHWNAAEENAEKIAIEESSSTI